MNAVPSVTIVECENGNSNRMRCINADELSVVVMRQHNINGVPCKDYTQGFHFSGIYGNLEMSGNSAKVRANVQSRG